MISADSVTADAAALAAQAVAQNVAEYDRQTARCAAVVFAAPVLLATFIAAVVAIVIALLGVASWIVAAAIVIVGIALGAAVGWTFVTKGERRLRAALGIDQSQSVTEQDQPRLYNLLESICLTTGVDLEDVLVLNRPQVNLLVLGSEPHAATLVVTQGLVDSLERIEIEALLALALGQVRDMRTASLTMLNRTVGLPTIVAETSNSALERLLAKPVVWITGRRLAAVLASYDDIDADVTAVGITRYPPGLMAALERASQIGTNVPASKTLSSMWLLAPDAADASGGVSGVSSGRASSGRASLTFRIQVLREL